MPPIPIHKNDPIHTVAAKPDGITPQTSNPLPTRTTPTSVPASTTSSASPPPPQPGARPIPPTTSAQAPASSAPPAPQPGYTATHTTTETRLRGPPAQFNISPPSDSQLSGRSTITSTQPSKPGPTTLNMGPVQARTSDEGSLGHPPGYVQTPDNNPYMAGGVGAQQDSGADGGVGGAAWNVLNKAGEALKKGEEAAWRAVRNK